MPPGVPAERVAAMRRAFDATMKDPEFLAEADKLKIEIDPMTGEQVAGADRGDLQDAGRDRRPRARRRWRHKSSRARSVIPRSGGSRQRSAMHAIDRARSGLIFNSPRACRAARSPPDNTGTPFVAPVGAALQALLARQADRVEARQQLRGLQVAQGGGRSRP